MSIKLDIRQPIYENTDIFFHILPSLVSLWQGNVKSSEKLVRIVNIEGENLQIFWKISKNFNENFRKDVTYENIKTCKKPELQSLSRKDGFEKITRAGQIDPSAFDALEIKFCSKLQVVSDFYTL